MPRTKKQEAPKVELSPEQRDEIALRAFEDMDAGLLKIEVAAKDLKRAKGEYSAIAKQAKKDGVNISAYLEARALKKRDPAEVIAEHNIKVHYLRLLKAPIGTQFTLFDDVEVKNVVPPREAGRLAGKNEEMAGNNPYQPGTEDHAEWHAGWLEHQTKLANQMRPEGTPPAQSPGKRRGRKAREAAAEPEAAPTAPTVDAGADDDWEHQVGRVAPGDDAPPVSAIDTTMNIPDGLRSRPLN